MNIFLDCNIYDKIESDLCLVNLIKTLSKSGEITIVCNQVVERELLKSPYGGIPSWFPVKKINEPGAFIGYALIAPNNIKEHDESYAKIMPSISTYSEHRGTSNKTSDAIIADTALRTCSYLVSEDKRLLERLSLSPKNTGCQGLTYEDFKSLLDII